MCCHSNFNNLGYANPLFYNNGFDSLIGNAGGCNSGVNPLISSVGGCGISNESYALGFTNGYYEGSRNRRRRCCGGF